MKRDVMLVEVEALKQRALALKARRAAGASPMELYAMTDEIADLEDDLAGLRSKVGQSR